MSRLADAKDKKCAEGPKPEEVLEKGVAAAASNVAAYAHGKRQEYLLALKVVRRGRGDYLAMLQRFNEDEYVREVAFGTGRSFAEAITNLNRTVGKGAWKRDKFTSM